MLFFENEGKTASIRPARRCSKRFCQPRKSRGRKRALDMIADGSIALIVSQPITPPAVFLQESWIA